MTRSSYGPEWDHAANTRRLAITRAVTAQLMAQQTWPNWTWVVLLHQADPNLHERMALYSGSAPDFRPIIWDRIAGSRQLAADLMPDWRCYVNADEPALMTRLDDDDGLAPDALERIQGGGRNLTKRTVLMLPAGLRIYNGWQQPIWHERNAMQTLFTPAGDTLSPYDYTHTAPPAPVELLGDVPGWLWVRHPDTISGEFLTATASPILEATRRAFPADWSAL